MAQTKSASEPLIFTGKSKPILQVALYNTTHWFARVCTFLTRADLLLWKKDKIPTGEVIYRTGTLSEKGLHCSTETERMRGAAERPKWIFLRYSDGRPTSEDELRWPLRINTYTLYTLQSVFFSALEWRYKYCIASNHILIHERAGSVQSLASLTVCNATLKDWCGLVSWSHPSFRSQVEMLEGNYTWMNKRRGKISVIALSALRWIQLPVLLIRTGLWDGLGDWANQVDRTRDRHTLARSPVCLRATTSLIHTFRQFRVTSKPSARITK